MSPFSISAYPSGCCEWDRLFSSFVSALSEIIAIELEQSPGNAAELRDAVGRQEQAKHALIRHLEAHRRCGSEE